MSEQLSSQSSQSCSNISEDKDNHKITQMVLSNIVKDRKDFSNIRNLNATNIKEVVNTKLKNDMTLLHLACVFKNIQAVNFLLECGSDTNAKNYLDETPIYYAQDCITLEKLLEAGAKLDVVSKLKLSPLDFAVIHGRPTIIKYLIDKNHIPLETIQRKLSIPKTTNKEKTIMALGKFMMEYDINCCY
ncbi:ankyrin repeat and EF-hand domain-containing protein 1-like [Phymastichus coffea]|uniref:ankyrin repeat and EF-hand domain-containing protein 1-like n=1 Tax=Phymastichus coffea TaxID=108790 RepID=UPI00273CD2AA|nr:ankyrin repeat and EF-hand domain-containing protein 1-like [Phymastichus coffea]